MKTIMRITLQFLMAVFLFALPSAALAQSPNPGDGKIVLGGTYTLTSGQTLNGSLAIFGGEATLEKGSRVNGDIALSGGTLSIQGDVSGSIAILGGTLFLSDTAVIHGDINTIGGNVNRATGAVVDGTITNGPSNFTLPLPQRLPNVFNFNRILDPIAQFALAMFQALVMAAIALVVTMLLPLPTGRVVSSITAQPLVAGGMGLLTLLIAPILILLLAITLILIPVSLAVILVLLVALAFGWIALGMELGQRMAVSLFHSTWSLPVAAGVGTLSLSVIANAANLIPCVGWVIPFFIGIFGLGGVLASRFGTQVYSPASRMMAPVVPARPTPPAPPIPPVAPQPPVNPIRNPEIIPPEEQPGKPPEA